MSYLDTVDKRKAIQAALNEKLSLTPPLTVDGVLGPLSAAAIVNARSHFNLDHQGEPVVDTDLERELGLLTIQSPEVKAAGNFILEFIINQALRGTGVNMDFAKISKAIAGGISGAIATTGTMAAIYIQLPPEAQTHFPSLVYSVLPWINEALGFIIGFSVVYFAPPNKTV